MSRLRIFTAVIAALVVFAVIGVGAALLLLDGNGGEQQGADDEVLQALTGGTVEGLEDVNVIAAQSLLEAHAFYCREPRRTREGQRTREECQRDFESSTQGLLDDLKGFDDSFKREQIDGALDTVKGLCDECEQMLRDARP